MNPHLLDYYTVQKLSGPDLGLYPINEDDSLTRVPNAGQTATTISIILDVNCRFSTLDKAYYNLLIASTNTIIFPYINVVQSNLTTTIGRLAPWYTSVSGTFNLIKTDSFIENLIKTDGYRAKKCGVWYGKIAGNSGLLIRSRFILPSYGGPSNVVQITYDTIIYNDGSIEYRYPSLNEVCIAGYVPTFSSTPLFHSYLRGRNDANGPSTPLSYINVFNSDLARQNSEYGGYRVNSEQSTPDLLNWPGQNKFGTIIRFVPPPDTIKKILPRKEIKTLDNQGNLFETAGMFDDRRSIPFISSVVTMPTQLPRLFGQGSTFSNTEPSFASDFVLTGSIKSHVIDNWLSNQPKQEIFLPYSEAQQPEQNLKATDFYLTGTAVSDVGIGFEGNLGQKTKITFELPILAGATLDPYSASLYYYDTNTKSIKEIASGSKQNPRTNIGLFGDARLYTALGTPVTSIASGSLIEASDRLLPFKGKNNTLLAVTDSRIQEAYQKNFIFNDNLFLSYSFGYNNVEPIVFNNQLSAPFLLEKVIFEFPLEAGSSWLNDYTQLSLLSDFAPDIGGPCITVGLIKESPQGSTSRNYDFITRIQTGESSTYLTSSYDTTRREVICSGTLIPFKDSVTPITSSNPLLLRGLVSSNQVIQLEKSGFKNYLSSPGTIIGDNSTQQFTGSVCVTSIPQVANCFYYSKHSTSNTKIQQGTNPSDLLDDQTFDLKSKTLIQNYKSHGTSCTYSINEYRNIFGKQLLPPALNIKNQWYDQRNVISSLFNTKLTSLPNSYCAAVDAGVTVNYKNTPYLLLPNDHLTFFISKYRSVNTGSFVISGSGYLETLYNKQAELSASHDVKIPSGSLKITLYGSYIKEKAEYNFQEQIFQNNISNVIGDTPVLDQFEIYSDRDLIGTTFDKVVKDINKSPLTRSQIEGVRPITRKYVTSLSYGVNPLNNEDMIGLSRSDTPKIFDANSDYRDKIFPRKFNGGSNPNLKTPWATTNSEIVRDIYEILGSNKVVKYTSPETIYDSLVPRIDDVLKVEGAIPAYVTGISDVYNAGLFCLGIDNVNGNLQPYDNNLQNNKVPAKFSNWLNSFPFESKYEKAIRQKTINAKYTASGSKGKIEVDNILFEIGGNKGVDTGGPFNYEERKTLLDTFYDFPSLTSKRSPNVVENNKFFYGFGNTKLSFSIFNGALGFGTTTDTIISQQFPQITSNFVINPNPASPYYSLTGSFGVSIKGWKYGLHNGFPTTTSCVFRRSHYGQFRDMLEQRPFTVFLTDAGLKTRGAVQVRFVKQVLSGTNNLAEGSFIDVDDPYETTSQNLSPFATSSLPYFDGLSRDR